MAWRKYRLQNATARDTPHLGRNILTTWLPGSLPSFDSVEGTTRRKNVALIPLSFLGRNPRCPESTNHCPRTRLAFHVFLIRGHRARDRHLCLLFWFYRERYGPGTYLVSLPFLSPLFSTLSLFINELALFIPLFFGVAFRFILSLLYSPSFLPLMGRVPSQSFICAHLGPWTQTSCSREYGSRRFGLHRTLSTIAPPSPPTSPKCHEENGHKVPDVWFQAA